MQISPGDAFLRNVSGSVAQPRPASRQVPSPQIQPEQQAPDAPTALRAGTPNSPPPVERAHAVERIAQGTIPRDVLRGSLVDIQA